MKKNWFTCAFVQCIDWCSHDNTIDSDKEEKDDGVDAVTVTNIYRVIKWWEKAGAEHDFTRGGIFGLIHFGPENKFVSRKIWSRKQIWSKKGGCLASLERK